MPDPCGYAQSSRPRFADGPIGPLAPGPAAPGAPPSGEARDERLALGDLASRGGWGFLLRSCVRGRLRPAAFARLRCGARRPGLRREVAGGTRHRLPDATQRRLALLGLASLGDPGHLRSSPLPKSRSRNPHPPRSATFLAWPAEGLKSALAKASESTGHGMPTGSSRVARSPSAGRSLRASPPGEVPAPQAREARMSRRRREQPIGVRPLAFRGRLLCG